MTRTPPAARAAIIRRQMFNGCNQDDQPDDWGVPCCDGCVCAAEALRGPRAPLARRPDLRTPAIAREPRSALLRRPGAPWRSLAPRVRDYPFCDTANCPWWRGYCTRDPSCDD